MKKGLFIAALLCGISFASNAATAEIKTVFTKKEVKIGSKEVKGARLYYLYEMTFDCPKQGWSIPVVGNSWGEVGEVYMYYQTHLDC